MDKKKDLGYIRYLVALLVAYLETSRPEGQKEKKRYWRIAKRILHRVRQERPCKPEEIKMLGAWALTLAGADLATVVELASVVGPQLADLEDEVGVELMILEESLGEMQIPALQPAEGRNWEQFAIQGSVDGLFEAAALGELDPEY
jgi:hypothetical protein